MKILHTGDLHIGKQVHGFSMNPDQEHILGVIIDYISEEKPDALIIAGDVYDKQIPPAEAISLFDRFITAAAHACPNILLIPGNHDSPERLGFASKLLMRRGVYFSVKPAKITLTDRFGEVDFYLLPFTKPAFARSMFQEARIDSTSDAATQILGSFNIDPNRRNILVAHQSFTATGEAPLHCESEIHYIGGAEAVNTAILREYRFDYAALGHLHGPQSTLAHHYRYSGSPLKYSFSEHLHKKSIVKAELFEKDSISIDLLPLKPLRDLRKIKGPFEALAAGESSTDYLHITYTDENEFYDAIGKMRATYPNMMQLVHENTQHRMEYGLTGTVDEDKEPFEMFSEFYRQQSGSEMTAVQEDIVLKLLHSEADL